ncbi:MAG: hypothetical protein AAGC55_22660 [Myxococcota bacterium]
MLILHRTHALGQLVGLLLDLVELVLDLLDEVLADLLALELIALDQAFGLVDLRRDVGDLGIELAERTLGAVQDFFGRVPFLEQGAFKLQVWRPKLVV